MSTNLSISMIKIMGASASASASMRYLIQIVVLTHAQNNDNNSYITNSLLIYCNTLHEFSAQYLKQK